MNPEPAFSWIASSTSSPRNHFVRFLRSFELPLVPPEAQLHLFADTRYRLSINGDLLGYGPARFYPSHPEYDTFDLSPHLRTGANVIEVEVWSAGSSNFQSVAAPGVFWAKGSIPVADGAPINLSTPGEWSALDDTSVEAQSIPLSFALGPVEVRDLALKAPGSPQPVETIKAPHAEPQPSTLPAMEARIRHASRLLYLGAGSTGGEVRLGCFRCFPDAAPSYANSPKSSGLYAARLYSPREQSIDCGLFWGDHFLNGSPLERRDHPGLGNRQDTTLNLRKGWNRLAGSFLIQADVAGMLLGFPRTAGLELGPPEGDAGSVPGFLCRPLASGEDGEHLAREWSAPSGPADPPKNASHDWQLVPGDSHRRAPARSVGWDRPAAQPAARPLEQGEDFALEAGPDGLAILTLDFASEFFGRPRFTLDCDAPCTVDVSYDEFLREDGTIDLFGAHWIIHSTDRFDFPAGSTSVEAFHNRGGRFLQFNLRTQPGTRIRLSDVAIAEFKTPTYDVGDFTCDDPFWNWLWQTSRTTLDASLEDVWSDSPWREQGCYLGDSLVQFHAHTCLSADFRLPARILRLFAQGQREDGQIPGVVPAAMERAHPDFTLLYVRFVRDYWAQTGDAALVRELWSVLEKLLGSETWRIGPHGLVQATCGHLFIDWSVEAEARQGYSSVLNAFYFDALRCAAELAPLAEADPQPYARRAESVRQAMDAHLWDESLGRYRCTLLEDGTLIEGRALHGNTIAFARGLADESKAARILPWLLGEIEDNAGKIIRHKESQPERPRSTSGQLEYYFLFYLIEALGAQGRFYQALPVIDDMWSLMRREGATTFWESVIQSYYKEGSLCHSWAVAPMIAAVRDVLGYRLSEPGNPRVVCIRPQPGPLRQAEGNVPHPDGPVHIRWQREGDDFHLEVTHPASAEFQCLPPPGIAQANFHLSCRKR